MNKDRLKQILREELLVIKINQDIVREHKRLVKNRSDFNSLVLKEFIKLEYGDKYDPDLLNEGIWDSIKHGISKLGSLEKGGKMFGKRGERVKAAGYKLKAARLRATKKVGEEYLNTLKNINKDFPNVKDQQEFFNILLDIGGVYDTLEKAVAADEINATTANGFVEYLRQFVKKTLDYDLADIYKHFKENKELSERELAGIRGDQNRRGRLTTGERGYAAPEGPKGKFTSRGAEGGDVDSTTMAGLKSNKAPLILGALGALGAGFGWLIKQPWFIDSITSQSMKTVWEPVLSGQEMGVTEQLAALNGTPGANLSSMKVTDFLKQMADHGLAGANGQPTQVLNRMAQEAGNGGFANWWAKNLVNVAAQNPGATLADAIPLSGAGASGAGGDIFTKKVVGFVAKKVASGAAGGAATAVAGQMAAASGLLTTLGLGTIAAGAAVKALRIKGLKSSRAALLADLYKELVDFPVPEEEAAVVGPETPAAEEPGEPADAEPGEPAAEESPEDKELEKFFNHGKENAADLENNLKMWQDAYEGGKGTGLKGLSDDGNILMLKKAGQGEQSRWPKPVGASKATDRQREYLNQLILGIQAGLEKAPEQDTDSEGDESRIDAIRPQQTLYDIRGSDQYKKLSDSLLDFFVKQNNIKPKIAKAIIKDIKKQITHTLKDKVIFKEARGKEVDIAAILAKPEYGLNQMRQIKILTALKKWAKENKNLVVNKMNKIKYLQKKSKEKESMKENRAITERWQKIAGIIKG